MCRRNKIFSMAGAPLLCLIISVLAAAQQPPPTLDMLVHDLSSTDEARQVRARQLLPRMGAPVARKMAPLLSDERQHVAFAALRVLEDICHETAVYGTTAEQQEVAHVIFSLIATDQPTAVKRTGLRLLPLIVDEHHDLTPVAPLLKDMMLKERARAALSEMRTDNALEVLCEALPGAAPSFRIDLLRTIFLFPVEEQQEVLEPLLFDPTPAVRAAALRTLASTGDPALLPHARRVCEAATEADAFEAWDGWLCLADALSARGGHWETAMGAYREILDAAPYTLIQSGAIVGMGRYGDETVVPLIMTALSRENGASLEPAALEAFSNMYGRAARMTLGDVFATASPTMQAGLLALFGNKADPFFFDIIQAQVSAENPKVRQAALDALRVGRFPGSAAFFAEMLTEASEAGEVVEGRRRIAAESLYDMALHLEQQGDAEGAGRAYLALYRHALDVDMRQQALDGVRRFPTPEAFDIVLDALAANDLDTLPVGTMMGVALNAIEAGREAEGRRILDDLIPRLRTTNDVGAAINAMAAVGPNPEFVRAVGIVNYWHLVGPFPWNPSSGFAASFIDAPQVSLTDTYEVDGEMLRWRPEKTESPSGLFDLYSLVGPAENVVAFGYAKIDVAEAGDAELRIGSDDGCRVWVNGKLVYEIDADRGYSLDADIVNVTFEKGCNELLIQVTQLLGGWAFGVRITEPDGAPLDFAFCD